MDPQAFFAWTVSAWWHWPVTGIPVAIILAILFAYEKDYENALRGFFWGILLWPIAYIGIGVIFLMWLMNC